MKVIQLANAEFLPHVCALVDEGHNVSIRARGNSMRPFVESGRDVAVLSKAMGYKVGDVVLAEIERGHYVLHRIDALHTPQGLPVKTTTSDPDVRVTLRGDGNVRGTEACLLRDVRCLVTALERKGKTWNTATSRFWHIYSRVWPALLPVRRYLLAAYRLLWLHELPKRWRGENNQVEKIRS
ncbi:MAG: S24/S26 family peptidase [Bacteroidales bacterium]|nr:S24/S26 family peptidase [Bacteroidales bacterium]